MLESLLADVLTRVLGQYVSGIDRDHITFGVWGGCLELRDLTLRAESVAILAETFGLDIPVTAVAGYIGLLRVTVPWKTLSSTPVEVHIEHLTVVARPVSGDSTGANELAARERRLDKARLDTDDAVREAAWAVRQGGNNTDGGDSVPKGWTGRLVSRIVENMQVEIHDVIVRFEDAVSDRRKPYCVAVMCKSMRAVSADETWKKAYVDALHTPLTRKIITVDEFRVDWAPLQGQAAAMAEKTSVGGIDSHRELRAFVEEGTAEGSDAAAAAVTAEVSGSGRDGTTAETELAAHTRPIIDPFCGTMRASLIKGAGHRAKVEGAAVELDIDFPDVCVTLNDVEYAALLQTSVYFAKLATRGFRPETTKDRWLWAVEQMLPGFRTRARAARCLTAEGMQERNQQRSLYVSARTAVLKARRTGLPEPAEMSHELEKMEGELSFTDVIVYREVTDRHIADVSGDWATKEEEKPPPGAQAGSGTTTGAFWSYLGYSEGKVRASSSKAAPDDKREEEREETACEEDLEIFSDALAAFPGSDNVGIDNSSAFGSGKAAANEAVRAGIWIHRFSLHMHRGGFPNASEPMVELVLRDLRVGCTTSTRDGLLFEAVLGTCEAWDLSAGTAMVYPRVPWKSRSENEYGRGSDFGGESALTVEDDAYENSDSDFGGARLPLRITNSSYPTTVSSALRAIRSSFVSDDNAESADLLNISRESPRASRSRSRGRWHSSERRTDVATDPLGAFFSETHTDDGGSEEHLSRGDGQYYKMSHSSSTRITAQEFLGNSLVGAGSSNGGGSEFDSLDYLVAFRMKHESAAKEEVWGADAKRVVVEVAVGRLEAVVDGPKGTFLWGLQFWQPKGTADDPIMAFLGAAAGARIAALRIELENAILAQQVPMRVEAVICAPRFIFPGKSQKSGALVVNMGTFGFRSPGTQSSGRRLSSGGIRDSPTGSGVGERYSSYTLSLDDLGVYLAPDYLSAVSRRLPRQSESESATENPFGLEQGLILNTEGVERIIRPFSLRLALHMLQDAQVVQVAQQGKGETSKSGRIAKVRLHGRIPGIRLVLSQNASHHLIAAGKRWAGGLSATPSKAKPTAGNATSLAKRFADEETRPPVLEEVPSSPRGELAGDGSLYGALTAFNAKFAVDTVSLELRDRKNCRIITLVASGTRAEVEKTGSEGTTADFRLQSWTVTDGSRGTTAAFRRLAYAGVDVMKRSVSPPRSMTASSSVRVSSEGNAEDSFVHIRLRQKVVTNEQFVSIRFLSLNMVCVRETYSRIAKFVYGTLKDLKATRRLESSFLGITNAAKAHEELQTPATRPIDGPALSTTTPSSPLAKRASGRLVVKAVLDGFTFQLASAEGALAVVEMSNFAINGTKTEDGGLTATGDVEYVAIRDLTSPLEQHSNALVYRRVPLALERLEKENLDSGQDGVSDGWSLITPPIAAGSNEVYFRCRFRGLKILFLNRFVSVVKRYFSILMQGLKPAFDEARAVATIGTDEASKGGAPLRKPSTRDASPAVATWKFIFEVVAEKLELQLPRHSTCRHEAITLGIGHLRINNERNPVDEYGLGLRIGLKNILGRVCYLVPGEVAESAGVKAPFLECANADYRIDMLRGDSLNVSEAAAEQFPAIRCRFTAGDGIHLRICEAQYTVLYFVLTENFIETVEESVTDFGRKSPVHTGTPAGSPPPSDAMLTSPVVASGERPSPVGAIKQATDNTFMRVVFQIPSFHLLVSRGWDVSRVSCQVLAVCITDLSGSVDVTSLPRLLVELTANTVDARDVRPEAAEEADVLVLPLETVRESIDAKLGDVENVSLSYDKAAGERANIDLVLSGIHLCVIPELFRDLACLALPGWPFLESSPFAPEVEYLGRTMSVTLSRSQVWLGSQQYSGDHRALILGGEVIARINWLQYTAAKKVSVQTRGLNLALTYESKTRAVHDHSGGIEELAVGVCESDAVVMYPGDGSVEYIGPNVDDAGRRLEIMAEFVLCRFNVKELPLIAAVFKRVGNAKDSALSTRDWKQANPMAEASLADVVGHGNIDSLATSQTLATRKTLTLLMSTGGARLLFTDESEGMFVPILEWNMRNCVVQANIPRVVQFASELSIDLFNVIKGWWEPGLESWTVELSQSTGRSGSQAFTVTSTTKLNINVTPAMISGATMVANALQAAVSGVAVDDPRATGLQSSTAKGSQRPSVAAFHVCNQLGMPLTMWLPHDPLRQSLRDGDEIKVDLPRDELIPGVFGGKSGDDHTSIRKARRCTLLLVGYFPLELSAAAVGVHIVHLCRDKAAVRSKDEETSVVKVDEDGIEKPVALVWDVKMDNGVPICTLRSTVRLLNETKTTMEISVRGSPSDTTFFDNAITNDNGQVFVLSPGAQLCVPMQLVEQQMRVRPLNVSAPDRIDDDLDAMIGEMGGLSDEEDNVFFDERQSSASRRRAMSYSAASSSDGGNAFAWSGPLPDTPWLLTTALAAKSELEKKKSAGKPVFLNPFIASTASSTSSVPSTPRRGQTRLGSETLCCRSADPHSPQFYLAVSPRSEDSEQVHEVGLLELPRWLDVVLQAPIILSNKLPGVLSYRLSDSNDALCGSGVIPPFKSVNVHSVDYDETAVKLAIAFENNSDAPENEELNDVEVFGFEGQVEPPTLFGETKTVSDIGKERRGIFVEPPASASSSGANRKRDSKELCVQVTPSPDDYRRLEIWTQFWVRNRSDVSLEVCGRSSYFSAGRAVRPLLARPPGTSAGRFLCLEGPFMSLRRMGDIEHAEWWTNQSDLGDTVKPIPIGIVGVSLVMEVRPALGSLSNTMIITIRNASWIVNRTPTPLQWCQSSALDSHGNCRMRDVHTLVPGDAQSVHWDPQIDGKSLSLRLVDTEGDIFSGWFWSPAVPFDMGNKGEFPAKMYRPKSQEQYIARIVSIKLHGGSTSLFVYPQDTENPPYRIVNNCQYRSIAFHQIGSEDRPWLVRPGKSTRYSWDNPLASTKNKELRIEVIEMAPEDWSRISHDSNSATGSPGTDFSLKIDELGGPSGVHGVSRAVAASWNVGKEYHHQKFNLNIDMVRDQPIEKKGSFEPGLLASVTVDQATKVVTFRDAGSENVSDTVGSVDNPAEESKEVGVPTMVWDDMSFAEDSKIRTGSPDLESVQEVSTASDFPAKVRAKAHISGLDSVSTDLDLNVYLASIGVSLVDSEPIELAYIQASGVFLKSERHHGATQTTFDVTDLQVDNQLPNAAFPVLLWAPDLPSDGGGEPANPPKTLALVLIRSHGDSEIAMWKSIRGAVRPLDLALDEEFVMRVMKFVDDVDKAWAKSSGLPQQEIVAGNDGEHLGIGDTYEAMADEVAGGSKKQKGSLSGLSRIYLQELTLFPVKIFLSSTASRGSHVRSAGYRNASLRTMVAILLNVENCEFDFAALELRHVFDSSQHFGLLVREYYLSQLNSQRMKLLTSNSLIGNPAALFDSVSIGARDLFVEPGRAKGSAEFLSSVGRGSKSLFAHTVGGLAGSIGGIPKAVSSGLETAVGDRQYLAERERIRGLQFSGGLRPLSNTPAQGMATGAMSLAHGISSGVAGIFTDPLKGAKQGGAAGFFRGVGKGLVGGIVKPVTGVMDLIAEPATGFSRSVASSDGRRRRTSVAPVRPPRAIPGSAGRLVKFDMRLATGLALLKAVQLSCSLRIEGDLLEWVELSDRIGRKDPESVHLIWSVVQRYSRPVRGVRRPRGNRQIPLSSRDAGLPGTLSATEVAQLEKLRIALVLESRVLVVTLDCTVIADLSLDPSPNFEVFTEGKAVVLQTARRASSATPGLDGATDTDHDIVYVWGRLECGSVDARNDLHSAINRAIEMLREVSEQIGNVPAQMAAFASQEKSVEMADISAPAVSSDLSNATPMMVMNPRTAADGTVGIFDDMPSLPGRDSAGRAIPSRGGEDVADVGIGNGPDQSRVEESDQETAAQIAARRNLELGSAIRRLKMGGTKRAVDSKRSIRIIVANALPDGQTIRLIRSSLDEGFWREQPPNTCPPGSVRMFEADSGGKDDNIDKWQMNRDIRGSVLFGVNPAGGDLGGSNISASRVLQVTLEFFSPVMSSPSYKAICSEGVFATHNRGSGAHATVVFTISDRDPGSVAKLAMSAGSSSALPLRASRDALSSSVALPLPLGLRRSGSSSRSREASPAKHGSGGPSLASVGSAGAASAGKLFKAGHRRFRDAASTIGGATGKSALFQGTGSSSSSAPQRPMASSQIDESSVKQLMELGFDRPASVAALRESNGDLVKAVDVLTR